MARAVFTMASGRTYSTEDSADWQELIKLANTASDNPADKLAFISTGNKNVLLNPLQVESIQFFGDGE